MPVLILKNQPTEGPGTIEGFLLERGIDYRIADLASGPFPAAGSFDTLLMLGGPMSANDEGQYPYLAREMRLAVSFLEEGKRVLGICLGAQLLAKALGARVYAGPQPEVGWLDIELLEDGIGDLHMKQLAVHPVAGDFRRRFRVFQWHGETFDIPSGAVPLARSDSYPNQAFRAGERAYAFQFHIEVTREMISEWFRNEKIDQEKLRRETEVFYPEVYQRARNFYRSFFETG